MAQCRWRSSRGSWRELAAVFGQKFYKRAFFEALFIQGRHDEIALGQTGQHLGVVKVGEADVEGLLEDPVGLAFGFEAVDKARQAASDNEVGGNLEDVGLFGHEDLDVGGHAGQKTFLFGLGQVGDLDLDGEGAGAFEIAFDGGIAAGDLAQDVFVGQGIQVKLGGLAGGDLADVGFVDGGVYVKAGVIDEGQKRAAQGYGVARFHRNVGEEAGKWGADFGAGAGKLGGGKLGVGLFLLALGGEEGLGGLAEGGRGVVFDLLGGGPAGKELLGAFGLLFEGFDARSSLLDLGVHGGKGGLGLFDLEFRVAWVDADEELVFGHAVAALFEDRHHRAGHFGAKQDPPFWGDFACGGRGHDLADGADRGAGGVQFDGALWPHAPQHKPAAEHEQQQKKGFSDAPQRAGGLADGTHRAGI